jgi:hypothetical protein
MISEGGVRGWRFGLGKSSRPRVSVDELRFDQTRRQQAASLGDKGDGSWTE